MMVMMMMEPETAALDESNVLCFRNPFLRAF